MTTAVMIEGIFNQIWLRYLESCITELNLEHLLYCCCSTRQQMHKLENFQVLTNLDQLDLPDSTITAKAF